MLLDIKKIFGTYDEPVTAALELDLSEEDFPGYTVPGTVEALSLIHILTLFEAPGLRCLSSGDGEKAVEDAVLASGAEVHADVFKAAHHGSSTSNTQAFLDAVRPQAVVVSCGAGNSYGHPHSEALAAFANVGAQVYRTDTEGTICLLYTSRCV